MKRISSFLFFFLFILSFSFSDQMTSDIDKLIRISPRPEASKNEEAAFSLISDRINDIGVNFNTINFDEAKGYYSFSKYIEVDILGEIRDTVISVVPLYSNYSIAAALSLIEEFSKKQPPLSLKFVFLGAENIEGEKLGTKNFLEHYYQEYHSCFIYMNFVQPPASIKIIPGTNGNGSPFFLVKKITQALKNANIPSIYSNSESILMRMSSYDRETSINEYLNEGYPAIQLNTAITSGKEAEAYISQQTFLEFFNNLLFSLQGGIPETWDNHYIFGINEQQYIFVLIFTLTLLMLYGAVRKKHFTWYMKTLRKNLLSPVLLFAVIFLFLSISTLIIKLILENFSFPDLWKYNSVKLFLFKVSISLLLYSLAFKLLKKLPFAKKGSFYSISILVFLTIQLFVLCGINLSFSFFALWPLLFLFLFTIVRKPLTKFVIFLLSLVPIISICISIFLLPSFSAIELLLLSPIQGNLLLSIIIMPFIMAVIRLSLYHPVSTKFIKFLAPVLGFIVVILFLLIQFIPPFNKERPHPVSIVKTVNCMDETAKIETESPKQIEEQTLEKMLKPYSSEAIEVDDINFLIDSKSFLNRKIINISLYIQQKPEYVKLLLSSNNPITLYESSLPTVKGNNGKDLEVLIGKNPEPPIDFSLTINKDAVLTFSATAIFPENQEDVEINNNFYRLKYIKKITKTFNCE